MMTSSSDYWTGLRDAVTGLAIDYGRAKLIDVERPDDDRYIPDVADLRYGGTLANERGLNAGSVGLLILGALAVGGVAYLALRR